MLTQIYDTFKSVYTFLQNFREVFLMNFLKRVVVKEELVALTGNMESAIILNQFIYWSQRIKDFDSFIKEENKRREKNDMDSTDTELQNGWIYKELGELKDEIMFTCSSKTVGRKLEIILNNGWLNRRNNPKYRQFEPYIHNLLRKLNIRKA